MSSHQHQPPPSFYAPELAVIRVSLSLFLLEYKTVLLKSDRSKLDPTLASELRTGPQGTRPAYVQLRHSGMNQSALSDMAFNIKKVVDLAKEDLME